MNYLQTHNRSALRRNRGALISAAVFVLIIVAVQFSSPHFLPAIFTTIARPFWRIEFSVISGSLNSPEYLTNQNEELKRQLADAMIRLQTNQSVIDENATLKNLLKRPVSSVNPAAASSTSISVATSSDSIADLKPSPYTLAAVLKRPPIAAYDELIIDLGQDNGVTVGNLVYAPGNVLIGQVSDTLGQTSKVALLSSPGMTYDVLIRNGDGGKSVSAVAHGLGGGQFSVQIPRDVVAKVGDIVTISSINNKTIGVVGAVVIDPAQPFGTILFTSLANVYELRWVFVDIKSANAKK